MNKKFLIGGLFIMMVVIVFIMVQPDEKVTFIPDETIEVEFCRQFITRAQLSKITGYEKGAFIFEYFPIEFPDMIIARSCMIKTESLWLVIGTFEGDGKDKMTLDKLYKQANYGFEKFKKAGIIPEDAGVALEDIMKIEKIEGVGYKAFKKRMVIPGEEDHIGTTNIWFVENDTKQIIAVGGRLDFETARSFAKQVDANLR